MNYLEYLKQPHYLALICSLISVLLAFIESKYSKTKYDSKYYIKIAVIVFINVFLVLQLVSRGIIPLVMKNTISSKSISSSSNNTISTPKLQGGGIAESSISPSNYQNVDIGNPDF